MIVGNLALKLEDFEEDYNHLYLVDDYEESLPDNIIQFPISKTDAKGNLITAADAIGGEIQYTYDTRGNLLTSTDEAGNTASNYYDLLDRVIRSVNPSGDEVKYEYDVSGNKIKRTDGEGNITIYEYDSLNRKIKKVKRKKGTDTFSQKELNDTR